MVGTNQLFIVIEGHKESAPAVHIPKLRRPYHSYLAKRNIHKRIRPYRRTFSVRDLLCNCRLSLVGTFELTNHFRIRYNILSNPRCQSAKKPCGHNASAKIQIIFRVYNDLPQKYTLFNRITHNKNKSRTVISWGASRNLTKNDITSRPILPLWCVL